MKNAVMNFWGTLWRSLFLLLLFVLFLEGGLRLYNLLRGEVIDEDLRALQALEYSNDDPYLQYTSLRNFHKGWLPRVEPGQRFEVDTNREGFRTHEFYPKAAGTYRILLLGDSFIFGANANQDETVAVKLEQGLRERLHKDIEVLSLGVSSYSGVRYAMLIRRYLHQLAPDMVIVAVDQSDLEEDVERINHYRLDQDGYPFILKDAEKLMREQGNHRIVIDDGGHLKIEKRGRNWLLDLRLSSALFDLTYHWAAMVRNTILIRRAAAIEAKDQTENIIRYENLVSQYGTDLSAVLPRRLQVDAIPYDLETAVKRYEPTLRCLRYIKTATAPQGIKMLLTSYPYPWMVSVREALPYQLMGFGHIYDFRANRVHPNLIDRYAKELGVIHLNAYPVFENQPPHLYGEYDPHFNARGYARYAEFLTSSLLDILKK